jgi:hypothetical protein
MSAGGGDTDDGDRLLAADTDDADICDAVTVSLDSTSLGGVDDE